MMQKICVENVTLRFRMSYDKVDSLRAWMTQLSRRMIRRVKPQYFTALRDVSLTVKEGEIVAIIGPNGCGKTTLLRSIAGIYYPDEGVISCRGRISTLLSLGTGFDNELNGIDNIRLNGLTIGMKAEEIDRCIPQIIEFADIGQHIYEPMRHYSSGMISRLSFAIVLAMQPDILLIDEVFSVGDLAFKQKSERAIHELLSRASCQLIVTHNLAFVRKHCNRVIYIRSGEVVADGVPDDVVAMYEKDAGVQRGDGSTADTAFD